jgi:hypothetical protein
MSVGSGESQFNVLKKKSTLPFIKQIKEGRKKRNDFSELQSHRRSLKIINGPS